MVALSKRSSSGRAEGGANGRLIGPHHSRFYLLLVIVKDAANRWRVSKSLRERGFAVTDAESFHDALSMTSVLQPDVVLAEVEPTQTERRDMSDRTPILVYPLAQLLGLTEDDAIKPALIDTIDRAIRTQYC